MKKENLETSLVGIRHLLSHLHSEVATLEKTYNEVLLVLRGLEKHLGTDELTGLKRRGAFFQSWYRLVDECRKMGQDYGILMIDIDHFKKVNDQFGHLTGDEVLRRVAGLLKQFESDSIVVGRYGGEEFAIGVRGSDAEVVGVAEMVRRGAEQLYGPVVGQDGRPDTNTSWRCTLSIGMASNQTSGSDTLGMLKAADDALYEAKRGGRNRVKTAS